MTDLTPLLDDPETSFAVIGATDTPGKYGGIIYRDLRHKGRKVYAVNPGRSDVAGDRCWPRVTDLPDKPTMAVLVVPAEVGLGVVADCAEAGIENVWVQPGAFSPALGDTLDAGGFDWLAHACVMVETRVS
ncbi:MAG: CoA-binding protein [Actinobacteria bacterium]|nr:CoA-binding protein [Actinomycetota bacterium]MCI0543853.1 CoA-binding protein [Actinomycetota bacterium]MCI0677822.1 CoA-binding protein [Actinomycetota bacterium]